jgi:hypothetical protein
MEESLRLSFGKVQFWDNDSRNGRNHGEKNPLMAAAEDRLSPLRDGEGE